MNLQNLKQKKVSAKSLVIAVLIVFAIYGGFKLEKAIENYLVNNLVIPAQAVPVKK